MTDADGHAVINVGDSPKQSTELADINASALPITSAPYDTEISERINGLCTDNSRVFGSRSTTVLIQGIINDYAGRAKKYEKERDLLRFENTDLRVENERLKTWVKKNTGAILALDLLMGFGFSGLGAALTMTDHEWKVGIVSTVIVFVAFAVKHFGPSGEAT
ncbi:MAG: hypothetical protein D3917_01915 [Candidatus Electrothrix sp. AX5]|nr:hypothetical protein [Candidatus Electrothrix sp. AX5]